LWGRGFAVSETNELKDIHSLHLLAPPVGLVSETNELKDVENG
jgi:hypothetical protein